MATLKKNKRFRFGTVIKARVLLSGLMMFFLVAVISYSLIYIAFFNPSLKQYLQEGNPSTVKTILARRGQILDRNGVVLAETVDAYSLWANPRSLRDPEMFAATVGSIIEMPEKDILEKINSQKERMFIYIKRKISSAQMQSILDLRKPRNYDFGFEDDQKREYPKNQTAASLIGYVGMDNSGLSGLEFSYNGDLSGIPGKKIVYETFVGDRVPYSSDLISKPVPGYSLVTSLDYTLQNIVEGILEKHVHRWNANGGVVIIMDPRTGEILSMASSPSFDLNQGLKYIEDANYFNQAVSMNYEPGSVFKTLVAAAALEEGIVTPMSLFQCDGSITVAGRTVRCMIPHGEQNLADIIRNSCNVAFVSIGMKLREKMYNYAMKFNFGALLPARLFGQEKGIILHPDLWHETTIATFSFGNGITTTPLQLASLYGAIANDGKMMQPMLIKETQDHMGNSFQVHEPRLLRKIVSSQTAKEMKIALRASIHHERGTHQALVPGLSIAGKTGTSKKVQEGKYLDDSVITSFVGFFPAENPQYIILVSVDDPVPSENAYGATVAAPIFKEIIQWMRSHILLN